MWRGRGPRMGGPPLAAGTELQAPARETSPCCCRGGSAFPSPASLLLLLTFQLLSYWHHSLLPLLLWSLHQTDVNPQCAGGSSTATNGCKVQRC